MNQNFQNIIKKINKENVVLLIKKRWFFLLIIGFCLFLSVGYVIGRSNTSKASILSDLQKALKDGDASELRSICLVNDKKIEEDALKPLINYYKSKSSKINNLISTLKVKGETPDFKLVVKDSLFGDKYYMNIKTYNIKINSNYNEGRFTLKEKKNSKIVSGNSFLRLIPGIYNINGTLKSEYNDISVKKEIVLMKNEEIDLNFNAINIKVNSSIPDAEIYINNKATGTYVRDNKEFGPLKSDGSVVVHIEKDYPWGRISSEKVEVKDIPSINLDINMKNDILIEDVNKSIKSFYKSVFESLNEEDKSKITNCSNNVKDKIYNIFEQSYFILKNEYILNDISINEDNSEFKYENGSYSANIIVDLEYTVSKYLGLSKSKNNKGFTTKLIYSDNLWVIDDVENFSL